MNLLLFMPLFAANTRISTGLVESVKLALSMVFGNSRVRRFETSGGAVSRIRQESGLPVIKCLPLTDIMDQHLKTDTRVSTLVNRMPHYYFDFYSLDVEGAEWSVLNSIDWNRTAFGLLFLEAPAGKPEERQLIQDFMTKEQGYTLVGYKRSSFWFQHPEYARIYADVPALTE